MRVIGHDTNRYCSFFMSLKARLEKPTLEDIYLIQHASNISDEQLEEIAIKIRNNKS